MNANLYSSGTNYQLMGGEKQTLQVILMPGQSIMTKHEALLYTSDNVSAQNVKQSFFGRCLNLVRASQKTGMNTELKNDTSSVGYAGLQLMKGKVIVIDNTLDCTQNLVVKEKYVIAHTPDLSL